MKVKRFLALLLVVVIAISVFAGCDVITKNEERDYGQDLAVIEYNGLSATVTKGEFQESFNSLAYYYVYYYGYTVEQAAQSIFDSLAQRELLILYVRSEMAAEQGKAATVSVAELLTTTEINEAVKSANETIQSWYDNIFTELEKEQATTDDDDTDDDTDEEEEETDTARPSRPDKAEAEIDYTFNGEIANAEVKFFDQADHYKEDYTAEQKVLSEKAVVQLKKKMADSYKTYDYYLQSAYETQLLSKYQRSFGENFSIEDAKVQSLINQKYNEYISINKEAFSGNVDSAYTTALGTLSTLVANPSSQQGYGYVYNILLKFSDEQTAALTAYKKIHKDTASIAAYRNALAKQILVNVTNPDYDATAEDGEENSNMYSEKNVNALTGIVTPLFDSLAAVDADATLNDLQKFEKKREIVTQAFYLVNDDTGMYDTDNDNIITNSNLGYLITPEGKTSSYVTEFTELGRALISGSTTSWTAVGTGAGAYGYCVTDYGIHIMFVSYIPASTSYVNADGVTETITETADGYYNLPLDYIVTYGRYDDENDNDKTLNEVIFDTLKSTQISTLYQQAAQNAISQNKDSITTNSKLWKKIIKEYNEQYNT